MLGLLLWGFSREPLHSRRNFIFGCWSWTSCNQGTLFVYSTLALYSIDVHGTETIYLLKVDERDHDRQAGSR